VLQPFLMGRLVSVHPLGVIVAIAAGILVAGIAGRPGRRALRGRANAVVQHLADTARPSASRGRAARRGPGLSERARARTCVKVRALVILRVRAQCARHGLRRAGDRLGALPPAGLGGASRVPAASP
jgi:hypothetical protein